MIPKGRETEKRSVIIMSEDGKTVLQDIDQNFQEVLDGEMEEVEDLSDTETIEEKSDIDKNGSIVTEDAFQAMTKLKATNFEAGLKEER